MFKSSYYEGAIALDVSLFHLGVSRPGRRSCGHGDGFSWIQVIFPWLCQKRVLRGTRLALDVGLFPLGVSRWGRKSGEAGLPFIPALDVSLFPLAGLPEGLVTGPQAYRKRIYYREI